MPVKVGAVEQYKRAFARQRARDLAQHADSLLCKDKQIAALQQECRQLETRLGQGKVSPSLKPYGIFNKCCLPSQASLVLLLKE